MQCQQPHVMAFPINKRAHLPVDTQGINIHTTRAFYADDFFPVKPLVPVHLVPAQFRDLSQCTKGFGLCAPVEREKLVLKFRVIEDRAEPAAPAQPCLSLRASAFKSVLAAG